MSKSSKFQAYINVPVHHIYFLDESDAALSLPVLPIIAELKLRKARLGL